MFPLCNQHIQLWFSIQFFSVRESKGFGGGGNKSLSTWLERLNIENRSFSEWIERYQFQCGSGVTTTTTEGCHFYSFFFWLHLLHVDVLGQGSNMCHSNNPSDNTRSLTRCTHKGTPSTALYKKGFSWVPLWLSKWRIQHWSGAGSIPGPGTSTCCICSQEKGFFAYIMSFDLPFFLFLFLFFFCLFRAAPMAYEGSQARGRIKAIAASHSHSHSHSNAGSLTHWARPGIKPATSWFLVGFISTAPWRELLISLS